ncbi:MAG: hypothetical protein EBS79_03520 [Gammaproteobacteria bacterium]|jgi:hypothetical protein|nr:hypothetical protein [Gammaproteobacteria bacterium]
MEKKTQQKISMGDRYGHWVVTADPIRVGADIRYRCLCRCGREKMISAITLRNGTASSCGCIPKPTSPRVVDLDAKPTPPEIQAVYTLISQGCLPPADQFSMSDGAPSWTLPTMAQLLGITAQELMQHLRARGSRFNPIAHKGVQSDFVLDL